MWPFSTIRNLRLELEAAESSNTTLHNIIARNAGDIRNLSSRIAGLQSTIKRMGELHAETEERRLSLDRTRITLTETIEQHVRNEKDLNRVLGGRDAMCKSLAAERDEAVLRARSLDQRYAACQNQLAEARLTLQGALVRDPKTGRVAKWVDPESKTPPLVSKTPEMYA